MTLLFLLPAWFAAFLVSRRAFRDQREAALGACIMWGVLIVLLTEGLSVFHALAFVPLLVAWGVISCASLAVCVRLWRRTPIVEKPRVSLFEREHFVPMILVAGIVSILAATLVVALVSPPNNWDSMTYHMARVANWIDHRSVRDYPTHILRQLWLGPCAEFAITNLQILARGDRFANCVQYVSMLGSVVGVSLLAKKLGANYPGQLIASVFCATIPIGLLEASTTQNDYVTAFWLLCFLNFTIDLILPTFPMSWSRTVLAGASLGLALLTKMTALIFAAPFILWVSLVLLRRRLVAAVFFFVVLSGLALAINAGYLIRNESVFGSPLGPPAMTASLSNKIHTPTAIAFNIIRNLAVHLGSVPKIGIRMKDAVIRIHRFAGLDVDDPRTGTTILTFSSDRCVMNFALGPCFSEDYIGNPFHLVIAGFAIFIMFWCVRQNHLPAIYSACVVAGFLLFCGYLKWQPWVSRLHLPLFVAVAPVCGLAFSPGKFRKLGYVLSAIIVCAGVLYVAKSAWRPLVWRSSIFLRSRTDLYFAARSDLRQPYEAAVEEAARGNPSVVGIVTGGDDWEYPLRVLLRRRLGSGAQVEHFDVQNQSRNCQPEIAQGGTSPDKIIVTGSPRDLAPRPSLPGDIPPGYRLAFVSDPIRIFDRVTSRPEKSSPH